jgi:hypothetical protein
MKPWLKYLLQAISYLATLLIGAYGGEAMM